MEPLSPEELTRINTAVSEAERHTLAEIVPVLAASSGRYDRAEDLFGACCGLTLWLFVELIVQPWNVPDVHWVEDSIWPILVQLACLIGGTLFGLVLSSHVTVLRRFFIPKREMLEEVNGRAREMFFDQRVHHTTGKSGVLLYVSLYERMAVVLADQKIIELVGQSKIDQWCQSLVNRLRSGTPVSALEKTITDIGFDLEKVLPGTSDNPDEIPDALITAGGL
jgi:Predicted membrane protein